VGLRGQYCTTAAGLASCFVGLFTRSAGPVGAVRYRAVTSPTRYVGYGGSESGRANEGQLSAGCGAVAALVASAITSCLWLMAPATRLQARCLEVTAAPSQQLLASAKSGGLPLVLMGASTGPDEVMKGIELGAVDFLEMPISPLKLRNIWQHVVRKVGDSQSDGVLLPVYGHAVPCTPSCHEHNLPPVDGGRSACR